MLISLKPARGYACKDCVDKHGKDGIIAAALQRDQLEAEAAGRGLTVERVT